MGGNDREAAYWALLHDVAESIYADVPSHVKRALRRINVDIDDLSHFDDVPVAYRDIIKAADKIEAMCFIQEYAHGVHARHVLYDIEKAFKRFIDNTTPELKEAAESVIRELRADPDVNFDLTWKHERA